MKKYIVLQSFVDKETKIRYEKGDFYPKLPSEERINILMNGHLVNFDSPVIAEYSDVPDDSSTVAEIVDYLDGNGIDHAGVKKKADLLALI